MGHQNWKVQPRQRLQEVHLAQPRHRCMQPVIGYRREVVAQVRGQRFGRRLIKAARQKRLLRRCAPLMQDAIGQIRIAMAHGARPRVREDQPRQSVEPQGHKQ